MKDDDERPKWNCPGIQPHHSITLELGDGEFQAFQRVSGRQGMRCQDLLEKFVRDTIKEELNE